MTALEMRVRSFKSSTDMNGPRSRSRTMLMAADSPSPPKDVNGHRSPVSPSILNFFRSLLYRSHGRNLKPRMFISSTSSRLVTASLSFADAFGSALICLIFSRIVAGSISIVIASKPSPRTVKYAQ